MINTGKLTTPFRSLGLMHVLDKFKFYYQILKYISPNRKFKLDHPGVALPPDYMLFESFKLDYGKYFVNGLDSASSLINELSPYVQWPNKKILDWGCGPARITRHLPHLLSESVIYGTDYNTKTIHWCREHISSVRFSENDIDPPTTYENDFFDVVFGISIFTHLSEHNHHAWLKELIRIITPGGNLLVTTSGIAFEEIMTTREKQTFRQGKLIIRDKAKEGHRVFTAFHPPAYMTAFFSTYCTILHHKQGSKKEWGIEQDTWILKKNGP